MSLFHVQQGSGPPTVWLHGLLGTGLSHWQAAAEHLDGLHLFPDLLGHGKSPAYQTDAVNPARQNAEAVQAWLAEQELERVHLVGVSMGADTALWLAVQRPALVETLTLVSVTVRMSPSTLNTLREQQSTLGAQLDGPELSAQLQQLHGERSGRSILEQTTQAYLNDPFQVDDGLLAGLNVPTLNVQGDRQVSEIEQGIHLRQLLPHGTLAVLPMTGHVVQWEFTEGLRLVRERFLTYLP